MIGGQLSTSKPVMKRARLKAWVPISPVEPPAPDCAGSVRQSACLKVLSRPSASPAGIRPARRGFAYLARRHHLAGLAHHRIAGVIVGQHETAHPSFGRFTSFLASASVDVSGLSQITWMPRFRNSRAAAKWTWLGVTIATASIPSLQPRFADRHLFEIVIDAAADPAPRRRSRLFGRGTESARDQLELCRRSAPRCDARRR